MSTTGVLLLHLVIAVIHFIGLDLCIDEVVIMDIDFDSTLNDLKYVSQREIGVYHLTRQRFLNVKSFYQSIKLDCRTSRKRKKTVSSSRGRAEKTFVWKDAFPNSRFVCICNEQCHARSN